MLNYSLRYSKTLPISIVMALGLGLIGCGAPDSGTPTNSPTEPNNSGPGKLEISTQDLEFGNVQESSTKTLSFTITNSGGSEVEIKSMQTAGNNMGWYVVGPRDDIDAGKSIDIEVTFAPTGADDAYGRLIFETNPADQSFEVDVSGQGVCKDSDNDGYCGTEDDCDDNNNDIHPDADEYCNGLDNDCNGTIDDNPVDGTTYYYDGDGDDYGAPIVNTTTCEKPPGRIWVEEAGDCNDANDTVNPGADEICDDLDNNCDGEKDEGFDENLDDIPDCKDNDLDGYCYDPVACVEGALPGDCVDTNPEANPGLEEIPADGVDNNCNGEVDENRPPTVEFGSPQDGELIERGTTTTIFVQADDLEDSFGGMDIVIGSDAQGELCTGETTGTNAYSCDVTLDYGAHQLTATVTDSKEDSTDAIITVNVDAAPTIEDVVRPSEGQALNFAQKYTFFAFVDDADPEQNLGDMTFTWSSSIGGEFASGTVQNDGLAEAEVELITEGPQVLTFTVFDDQGVSASVDINVVVGESPCATSRNTVALYHMDEGGGSELTDSSGNELHGIPTGVVWTSGKFDTALSFDGSTSAVEIPNRDGLLSLQTFTIESWVNFPGAGPVPIPVASQPLIYKSAVLDNPVENYDLRIGTGGSPQENGSAMARVEETGTGQELIANGAYPVARNTWHLVTATYDGDALRTYLDGNQVGYFEESITLATGDVSLYLGTDRFFAATNPRTLNGALDEIRIMNCALTERQIQEDFNNNSPHEDPEGPEDTPTPTATPTGTPAITPTVSPEPTAPPTVTPATTPTETELPEPTPTP